MVKQLLSKAGSFKKPTLAVLGWLTFFSSFFTTNLVLVISLQSVARVLP